MRSLRGCLAFITIHSILIITWTANVPGLGEKQIIIYNIHLYTRSISFVLCGYGGYISLQLDWSRAIVSTFQLSHSQRIGLFNLIFAVRLCVPSTQMKYLFSIFFLLLFIAVFIFSLAIELVPYLVFPFASLIYGTAVIWNIHY